MFGMDSSATLYLMSLMISRAPSLMILLFSRAVSLICDDFQSGSISDGLNDISRARSQYSFRI